MVPVVNNRIIYEVELDHPKKLFHLLKFVTKNSKYIQNTEDKFRSRIKKYTFPDPTGPIIQMKSPR